MLMFFKLFLATCFFNQVCNHILDLINFLLYFFFFSSSFIINYSFNKIKPNNK